MVDSQFISLVTLMSTEHVVHLPAEMTSCYIPLKVQGMRGGNKKCPCWKKRRQRGKIWMPVSQEVVGVI